MNALEHVAMELKNDRDPVQTLHLLMVVKNALERPKNQENAKSKNAQVLFCSVFTVDFLSITQSISAFKLCRVKCIFSRLEGAENSSLNLK